LVLNVNLAGKPRQQSTIGGVVSLLAFMLLTAQGLFLFKGLVLREGPQITTYEMMRDLIPLGSIRAEEFAFDLAV
jgi:hypothetical protein